MADVYVINKRRPVRRFLRWVRVLFRGAFEPVFSFTEVLALVGVLGYIAAGVFDQLSYVALVCAERFMP